MIGMDESGNAVRKTADISPGDRLTLRLSDGSADCLITGVEQFTDNEFSGTR